MSTTPTWSFPERTEFPTVPAGERAALESFLEHQRETLLWKCGGLTPEQLATKACPPSSVSLLGLVRHMTEVESWFHAYDGQPCPAIYWSNDNPEGDFDDLDPAQADADLDRYLKACDRSRAAVAERGLDDLDPEKNRHSLRWIYLHMIEEYARHNGHADFLRETLDGATGE